MEVRETTIVNAILRHLRALGGYAVKIHGDRYTRMGTPDILGSLRSVPLAFEVKTPSGSPTKIQLAEIAKWREAGAIAGVVTSVQEVDLALEGYSAQPCPKCGGKLLVSLTAKGHTTPIGIATCWCDHCLDYRDVTEVRLYRRRPK